MDLKQLMQLMSSMVDITSTPDANQMNILRDNVFECALRGFRRARFNPEAKLDVVFRDANGIEEEAADKGGPTRECLRLLISAIHSSDIFEGPDWEKSLSCSSQGELLFVISPLSPTSLKNCQLCMCILCVKKYIYIQYSTALYDGVYKQVGRIISVCLVHGGVEPQFFFRTALQASLWPTTSCHRHSRNQRLQLPVTDIAEINDYNFREKLTKVLDTVNVFISLML